MQTDKRLTELQSKLKNPAAFRKYIPSLDTLATSVKFLQANPQLLRQAKDATRKLDEASEKLSALKSKLQSAEEIKAYLREQKKFLQEKLSGHEFTREFKKLNKEAYYYSQQLKEYRELLADHKKA